MNQKRHTHLEIEGGPRLDQVEIDAVDSGASHAVLDVLGGGAGEAGGQVVVRALGLQHPVLARPERRPPPEGVLRVLDKEDEGLHELDDVLQLKGQDRG